MRTLDNCPACSLANTVIVAELNEERRARFVSFSQIKFGGLLECWLDEILPVVLRCKDCGHCWYRHQPEPEQLGQMYASSRPLTPNVRTSREPLATMIAEMNRLFHLVGGRHGSALTLLDYGSGFGRWARAAVQVGFVVTAFEPSAERGAEEQVLFELIHDRARLRGRRFSVIQLEQVLEHTSDPLATLNEIKDYCTHGTVVRVTVPNVLRAPEGKNLWANWPFDGKSPHVLAPFEHLHGFTPRSLSILVRRAGFVPIPASQLIHHHPILAVRRLLSTVMPSVGATSLFLQVTAPGHPSGAVA